MERRELLRSLALIPALPAFAMRDGTLGSLMQDPQSTVPRPAGEPRREVRAAFPISQGATVIDFAGPWEAFINVMIDDAGMWPSDLMQPHQMPFELFTVAEKPDPVAVAGGMKLVPNYTFTDVPAPDIVVVAAQHESPGLVDWIRETAESADLTMSVCTGTFILARTGLLDGKTATTHHDYYDMFAREFPEVELVRGKRFVEHERIATAGGLTSGIDLALRVVERYFGRDVTQHTAAYMEYQSTAWIL